MAKRKVSVLLVAMILSALAVSGLTTATAANDEDSPLHKLMEKVQAHNSTILKGVRNPVMFKKSQDKVVEAAKELSKLGKEARAFTEPAKEQKQPQEKWTALMDSFIKEADTFGETAAKKDIAQAEVKNAYKGVQKSCTNCHDIFRKDEDF